MPRIPARIAAVATTGAAVLALTGGTAPAGSDDQRCEKPKGVVVVCTAVEVVDLDDLDADVDTLTDLIDGHHR